MVSHPELPRKFDLYKVTYSFVKQMGSDGSVGLYRAMAKDKEPLVLKIKDTITTDREYEMAHKFLKAVASCSECPTCKELNSSNILRVPLSSWKTDNEFSFSVFEFYNLNLAEWLVKNRVRSSSQVISIFSQITSLILCLREIGFYYTDIKPSNFLLSGANSSPRLTLGDLGGLDTKDMKSVTVTPGRLPPGSLKNLDWAKLDAVTSFLIGGLILQLLVRPSNISDSRHPLDAYFECLQTSDGDSCTGSFLSLLPSSLADGLHLKDKGISDLIALSLTLLGYRNLFLPLKEAVHIFKHNNN